MYIYVRLRVVKY